MGKSKQTTTSNNTTTQTATPYTPAQPGIDAATTGITNWMNDPRSRSVYSGPRSVGPSDYTNAGIRDYADTTGAREAVGHLRGLIGGSGPNPYMDQLMESVRASVMPGVNQAFSSAGMGGSTIHQGVLGREITRATAPHLFNAYESDQNRRLQAAGMLPGMEERIGQRQIEAGQISEGYDRERIAGERDRFDEERMAGLNPYATGLPLLTGVGSQFGTQSGTSRGTQTTSQSPSLGQQILGGGMMLGSMFTGMPMGMMGSGFRSRLPWESQ